MPQAVTPSRRIARDVASDAAKSERATIGVKGEAATWMPIDAFAPSVPNVRVRTTCVLFVT